MVPNIDLAVESIIPSELTGPLPRRTCLAKNGIVSAIVVTILLVAAGAMSFRPSMNALQKMQTKATLRNSGSDVIGKVERTRGYYLDYSFAVDGRSFTGHAFMPDRIQASLKESDPISIRYLTSNPATNRPADWDESDPLVWLPFFLPIILGLISVIVMVFMRIDRRLVAEGTPAVAVVTKFTEHHGRSGGFTIKYEFRNEDGTVITGSSECDDRPETDGSICILYMPKNPRRNQAYSTLWYRVAL